MVIIQEIKEYDVVKEGSESMLKLIERHWCSDYGTIKIKNRNLELHTGGYSDNEDVINSLHANYFFWALCWEKSVRGGHYYFKFAKVIN